MLNHQAAGIDLACTSCAASSLQLSDATTTTYPTWVKVLAGMTALVVILAIVNVVGKR